MFHEKSDSTILPTKRLSVWQVFKEKHTSMFIHIHLYREIDKMKSLPCTQKRGWNRSVIWNLCHLWVKGRHTWGRAAFQFYIAKHPALQGNKRTQQL